MANVEQPAQAGNGVSVDPPKRFSRTQKDALASCYWMPCYECGEKVPVIKAVGSPAAGFKKWHRADCAAVHPPKRSRR